MSPGGSKYIWLQHAFILSARVGDADMSQNPSWNGGGNGRGRRRWDGSRGGRAGMMGGIIIFLKLYLGNLYSLNKRFIQGKKIRKKKNFPFHLVPASGNHHHFSTACMSLASLHTPNKWNHTVFVLL